MPHVELSHQGLKIIVFREKLTSARWRTLKVSASISALSAV